MTTPIVFLGSADFAVTILERLAEDFPIRGVVTQPDRPAGRGRTLQAPPVKILAEKLGIPVIQPEKIRHAQPMAQIRAWNPDLIVVAAYGQILRQDLLDLPRLGCINVHGSLLPRWRGAAPIQAALLQGDRVSGASIMLMDAGIDTGAVLAQQEVPILPEDTAGSLFPKIAQAGANLLAETLPRYIAGNIQPVPQDESQATYARMLRKEDGFLDFQHSAGDLVNRVRAFTPWPGASLPWQGAPLRVLKAAPGLKTSEAPGTLAIFDSVPAIAAADRWLLLLDVQPAGKKPMSGRQFLLGGRNWSGILPAS